MKKVKGNDNLEYHDSAIINTDTKGYEEYINKRHILLKQQSRETQMQDRINILNDEVSEMRALLHQLLKDKGAQ